MLDKENLKFQITKPTSKSVSAQGAALMPAEPLSPKQMKALKLQEGKNALNKKQEGHKKGEVSKDRQDFIANMHQELEKKIENIG